ncbi:DNA polymerase [Euzebya tangerina]|uniref:DNA polymerase n=1 Tax=Euzebya tangerina TaxID=591198 RepID=UPI000E319A49|nr:DNA polymerase [Euzebya tangerina]
MEVLQASSAADVSSWLAETASVPFLAVDTETTGWDPWRSRVRLVQVAAGPAHPVLVLDTARVDAQSLSKVLADTQRLKVFHNAAFDLRMLWATGLDTRRVADTMLAQQLLDGVAVTPVGASLAAIALHRFDIVLDKSVRTTFMDGGTLTDTQIEYGALDARVTWDTFAEQIEELKAQGMVRVARLEFDALRGVTAMQHRGIGLDADAWRTTLAVTERRLPALHDRTQRALVTDTSPQTLFGPEPVNLDSPEQVITALGRTGLHLESTREAVLRDHTDHPAVDALLAYRQAAKLVSGWGGDWVERALHPTTGRVHASIQQIVGTGRMAHSDPNLTQIPADPTYRRCFVPGPGNVMVVADYSQQELRVLAAVSGDAALTEVFASGADLHSRTAATVFGVDAEAVSADQRKAAKALNFGLMYGMGVRGFARATGMTEPDARAAMDAYFAGFPQVAAWLRGIESQARRTHRVATPLGRARYLTDAGTFARNAPIQGAGADMTKLAVARTEQALADRFGDDPAAPRGLVLTVHDELVAEVPAAHAEEGRMLVEQAMVEAGREVLGEVPPAVDVAVGSSWAAKG